MGREGRRKELSLENGGGEWAAMQKEKGGGREDRGTEEQRSRDQRENGNHRRLPLQSKHRCTFVNRNRLWVTSAPLSITQYPPDITLS